MSKMRRSSGVSSAVAAVLLVVGLVVGAGVGYGISAGGKGTTTTSISTVTSPGSTVTVGTTVTIATSASAVSCSIPNDSPSIVYKVGVIEPLTGSLGSLGKEIYDGANLAAYQWNSTGGVPDSCGIKHSIQLLLEDGGPDTTSIAFTNLQSLAAQGVQFVIGPCCSADFSQFGPYVSQHHILTVSSSATAGFVTANFTTTPNYIWRTVPSDNVQTLAIAAYVQHYGYHHVELVVSNEPYGLGIANGAKANLASNSSITAKIVPYDTGSANYGTYPSIIQGIAGDKPDVIVYAGFVQDLVVFWKDVAVAGPPVSQIPTMGVEGDKSTTFFPYGAGNSGPCANGGCPTNDSTIADYMGNTSMTGTATLEITNSSQYSNFVSQYQSKFNISCANGGCLFAPETYDAANLTFKAIVLGGSYNSTAAAAHMVQASQGYVGAAGPKTFTPQGDVAGPYNLWRVTYNSTAKGWQFTTVGDWVPSVGLNCALCASVTMGPLQGTSNAAVALSATRRSD
jgi:ABC-type branched-subunit amino acid transport system substrate-binding protein